MACLHNLAVAFRQNFVWNGLSSQWKSVPYFFFQKVLQMSGNNSDAVDQHVAFGDLDALIAALSCAIQEEIDTSKVQNKVGCIGWYPLTSQADFG